MIDCGIDKDGTLGIPNPETIDAVLLSHAHIDHIGSLLYFFLSNKNCRIFIPEGAKKAMKIALLRTHEIQSRQTKDDREYKNCTKWLQESRELVTKLMNYFELNNNSTRSEEKMSRKGRKQPTLEHEERAALEEAETEKMKQTRKHTKETLTKRL